MSYQNVNTNITEKELCCFIILCGTNQYPGKITASGYTKNRKENYHHSRHHDFESLKSGCKSREF